MELKNEIEKFIHAWPSQPNVNSDVESLLSLITTPTGIVEVDERSKNC